MEQLSPPAAGRGPRVVVGVHDGVLSGVNTYAEHLAATAAGVGADVTLLATHRELARELARRLADTRVRVIDLGMEPPTPTQRRLERLSPAYAAARLRRAVELRASQLGKFDLAHANHPPLAEAFRPIAGRVLVAAWFHPHAPLARALETWRHTGRRLPRSAGLAIKGVLHYRNDVRGYRLADWALAPTELLTEELCRIGVRAAHFPPPCRVAGEGPEIDPGGVPGRRLLICSGDLAHPRKNVRLAIEAVALLARWSPLPIRLDLVGRNAARLAVALGRLPPAVDVRPWGRLPPADVHALMAVADVFLLPSLFEEWGYVAVEAALHGARVVALPVYPFEEMLSGSLGTCARGATPQSYAEAVGVALEATSDRTSVAAAASERFGEVATGRRLLALWATASLPDEPPAPPPAR